MLRLGLVAVAFAVSPSILFAGEDWTQDRLAVRLEGETASVALRPVVLAGAPRSYALPFPVTGVDGGRTVTFVVTADAAGGHQGADQLGITGVLGGTREGWRLEVDALVGPANGARTATGRVLKGTRGAGGAFVEQSRRAFTITFTPQRAASGPDPRARGRAATRALLASAGLTGAVPAEPVLVPGVGAPVSEVRAALEEHRDDELTVVFWNVGKGEHRGVGPKVALPGGGEVDALSANVRALAATLRPDFLVIAEASEGSTLDPDTQAVLRALYPGRLAVPAMWEHPTSNQNAIFSRWDLVQVAGDERARRPDGGFDTTPWRQANAPAPGERVATITTRWLDWTPLETTGDLSRELAYRAQWTRRSDWHTRSSIRVDFTLGGLPCTVFPLHLAMPWLELEPLATRDGFLVDGVQDSQLHRTDPLYHQIARLRDDLQAVPHGRLLAIGDMNIAEHPRPNFPPLRQGDDATGDGRPARDRSLAFELLAQGLHNAFQGDRDAWSWPNPSGGDPRVHVLARNLIDNALHGSGFEVRYRGILFPRGADHGAIAIKVRLRRSGAPLAPFRPIRREPPLGLDVTPPAVEISSPARGALVPLASEVEFVGRVTDASGVASLSIAGADVALDADGAFRARVSVREGLNVIDLTASDAAGNVARGARSVVVGRASDPAAPIEDALVVRLNRPAFVAAEQEVGTRLGAVDLDAALRARNPLFERHLAKGRLALDVKVEARSLATGAPRVTITPEAGGLRVRVRLPDVAATLHLEGKPTLWGWTPSRPIGGNARLSAREATVEVLAKVDVGADGRVTTRLEGADVRFTSFLVEARLLPTFAQPIVSAAVQDVVARLLEGKVRDLVPPALDAFLAKAVAPVQRPLLGRQLTVRALPRAIVLDADGATIRLAADLDLASGSAPDLGTHVGSLATTGAAPALGTSPGVLVAIDDDLLNRAGHAAWRSGALALSITRESAQRLGLPAWLGRVDAAFVGALVPEATAGLPPATPLELEVVPAAPPIFRPRPDGALELGLGDVAVRIFAAPPGGARRLVLQVSASALVPCAASVDAEGRLSIATSGAPTLRVDAFDGPATALHQAGVEGLLETALPQALGAIARKLSGIPLPSTNTLRATGVRVTTEGPSGEHLAIGGDLR